MKCLLTIAWMASCLFLSACSNMMNNKNVAVAHYQIHYALPSSPKWEVAGIEQDAGGYAKSYRLTHRSANADQSFYINYGYQIKTPLLEAMNEVVGAMASTGCKKINSNIVRLEKESLSFTAIADHCLTGRAISQVFKVFNMPDGQYAIVYSANPHTVSASTQQTMKAVVLAATIS